MAYLSQQHLNGSIQQRWGSRLTPIVLTASMRNADSGYMTPFADLLDEFRETDPHLHGVLGKREWTVAGAEWEMRPASRFDGFEEPKDAAEIRMFVSAVLAAIPSFPDRIADIMSAIYYGRSVLEVVWEVTDGWTVPKELLYVHPRNLHYDHFWKLRLWSEGIGGDMPFGSWPGLDLTSFPSGQFIVHSPRIRGGYATREGLGRPLAWYSMFKRWAVRDAMGLAEMAGRMARIGTYNTGALGTPQASENDKQVLERALEDWTSSTALIHPDTTKVELVPPVAGETIHTPLVDMFNAEMSKVVLGETLTTDAGRRGARSLGEVHAQQGRMIARYDAQAVAETIRRYLIAPLVLYNFGPRAAVPRIVFSVDPQESLDSLAKRISLLIPVGLQVSQSWVRNAMGIADPAPGEQCLGVTYPRIYPSVADPYEEALAAAGGPGGALPEEEEPAEDDKEE